MTSSNDPSPPLTTSDLTAFCKATADSLRLNVLRALRNESFGVMELCQFSTWRSPVCLTI